MKTINTESLIVTIKDAKKTHETEGVLKIQFWNSRERIIRAFLYLISMWGTACLSIVIPVLHFILVPGFVLAGPIMAIIIAKQEKMVIGGEGPCPVCQNTLAVDRVAFHFPIIEVCSKCHTRLYLEETPKAAISA
jgi:hypothetical protein